MLLSLLVVGLLLGRAAGRTPRRGRCLRHGLHRLGDRIRQKEGLSYGVNSSLTVDALEKRGSFRISAICNPANMEKLEKFGGVTAFGRPGQPAELASIYVQLAAADASFATGQVYGSAGGTGQP